MARDSGILHVEPGCSLAPLWVLLAVTAVGAAIDSVVRSPGDALSIVLCGVLLGVGGIGPYVAWERRQGRIEVTANSLRVGRERFALADLDPLPLAEQAAGERYTGTTDGWLGDHLYEVRLAGPGWARALGDHYLIIRVRGRPGYFAVPTTDPRRLARLLHEMVDCLAGGQGAGTDGGSSPP